MKTLEGQKAIEYLSRLNTALDTEVKSATFHPATEGLLLLALFRLEQGFFQSYPSTAQEQPQLLITASGFPSLPPTLAHAEQALKLHQSKIEQKISLAKTWLSAAGSFSDNDLSLANHTIQTSDHPYPEIAQALAPLTPEQITHIRSLCQKPQTLPVFTNHRRNLLVTFGQPTSPFCADMENTKKVTLYYRKFIDSEPFDPNLVLGDPKHPIDDNNPPNHARFPVILAGELDKDCDHIGNAKQIFSPRVTAYLKFRELKNSRYHTVVDKHQIASQIELTFRKSFFGSNHTITEAFLDTDFTALSKESVDQAIANSAQIQDAFSAISQLTESMTSDQVVTGGQIRKQSERLTSSLEAIADPRQRQTFQHAVNIALEKLINPISTEVNTK